MKKTLFLILYAVVCISPLCAYAQYGREASPTPQTSAGILTPSTEKPIEIWVFPGTHRLVTGKALILTVQVIWRLGINVHLDDLMNVDLSPFRVDRVTIGERQIFDNERDYRVVQYVLSLPDDAKEGRYKVPSFGISFVDEVEQREGLATSSPISVQKVPLVITGRVDRDVIEIGDVIHYSLTILYEKDTEILLQKLKETKFEPFSLLHSSFRRADTPRINRLLVDYYLSIYEMGSEKRKYEIPPLSVFYFKPAGQSGGEEKVIDTKEVRTQPIPVVINKLLKAVDVPLEGLKGPMVYSRSELYFQGYFAIFMGVSLLLLILTPVGVRRIRDSLFPAREAPPETPELAARELREIVSSIRFSGEELHDRRHLEGIDTALRVYLGALSGLPGEKARALTTSEMLTRIPADAALPAKEILRGLDTLIFGEAVEKNKAEELVAKIEDFIKTSK